jgi:hypothetical protein
MNSTVRVHATQRPRIRPLKDPLILYVNDTIESELAKEYIEAAGITPFITDGPVEPLERKPLVIHGGGFYQGLDEIKGLLNLLEFWSNQPIERSVFKNSEESNEIESPT